MTNPDRHVPLTEPPAGGCRTFLDFPSQPDLDQLSADFAVLGVPFGKPYDLRAFPNEQSRAPDALRRYCSAEDVRYTRQHYDFDLGGPLLGKDDVRVVDCGNVTSDPRDPAEHYRRAESAARRILSAGAVLVAVGGDHGVTIPLLRALNVLGQPVTLVHVDAHLDWRDEINGEREGYSSPIRRASEMPWIGDIVQMGMRGIGSARQAEVDDALAHGCQVITAYEVHRAGMEAVLERIPQGGPYYLSIDADGLDPTIMPGVLAPTPGGLDWVQVRQLLHGLAGKGPIVGLDLVEMAPARDLRDLTLIYAERLICNFIGATIRAGHRLRE
jgi:agmatinase